MAQFLRPISTTGSTITWTGVGSGNLWANLDEASPGDADYIHSPNDTAGYVELGLATPGTTPNTGTCTARWREAKADDDAGTIAPASGGNDVGITCVVWADGAAYASSGLITASDGVWTTRSFTFSNLFITNWSTLRVRFEVMASGGNKNSKRAVAISWFELEVPDGIRRVLLI